MLARQPWCGVGPLSSAPLEAILEPPSHDELLEQIERVVNEDNEMLLMALTKEDDLVPLVLRFHLSDRI